MKRLSVLLLFLAGQAIAWDGTHTGRIHKIDVTGGNNYGFRVELDSGTAKLCGNEYTWAYINESDSNYQSYVSVLLAAKMADKTVTVYANQDDNHGYCQIGYISIR